VNMALLEPGFLVDVAPETDVLHFSAGMEIFKEPAPESL
jgi:hypothetical protein